MFSNICINGTLIIIIFFKWIMKLSDTFWKICDFFKIIFYDPGITE